MMSIVDSVVLYNKVLHKAQNCGDRLFMKYWSKIRQPISDENCSESSALLYPDGRMFRRNTQSLKQIFLDDTKSDM